MKKNAKKGKRISSAKKEPPKLGPYHILTAHLNTCLACNPVGSADPAKEKMVIHLCTEGRQLHWKFLAHKEAILRDAGYEALR